IGDTPRDIACARADGLRCIAVTTGPHGREELLDADAVAESTTELAMAIEALAAGVPVVARADLPSLAGLAEGGRILLAETTAEAIGAAVCRLLDDGEAARLFRETEHLKFATWAQFSGSLAAWVGADGSNR
ncbi:MAG: HAD hydrolase-like protein, partial [Acetobacteraceae bacterium]